MGNKGKGMWLDFFEWAQSEETVCHVNVHQRGSIAEKCLDNQVNKMKH